MKTLERLFCVLAVMFFAVSCDIDATPDGFFRVYGINMGYKGGSSEIEFHTNGPWMLECEEPGVTMNVTEGYGNAKVSVTVPENHTNTTKTVSFDFTTTIGERFKTMSYIVTLDPRPFVVCEDNLQYVSAEGGRVRFYVNSNFPWKVAYATCDGTAWDAQIIPDRNDVNGVYVTVIVPENESADIKTYEVGLVLESYDFATTDLVIYQNPRQDPA